VTLDEIKAGTKQLGSIQSTRNCAGNAAKHLRRARMRKGSSNFAQLASSSIDDISCMKEELRPVARRIGAGILLTGDKHRNWKGN